MPDVSEQEMIQVLQATILGITALAIISATIITNY